MQVAMHFGKNSEKVDSMHGVMQKGVKRWLGQVPCMVAMHGTMDSMHGAMLGAMHGTMHGRAKKRVLPWATLDFCGLQTNRHA